MPRALRALLALTLLPTTLHGQTPSAERVVRQALARFEAAWKSADDPRARLLEDAGWKAHFEALRDLARTGPDALPHLQGALKSTSVATRAFAADASALLRGPEAVRKELLAYDLKHLDTARLDRQAPDFTLIDDAGKPCRLSAYRGKSSVIVLFLLEPR